MGIPWSFSWHCLVGTGNQLTGADYALTTAIAGDSKAPCDPEVISIHELEQTNFLTCTESTNSSWLNMHNIKFTIFTIFKGAAHASITSTHLQNCCHFAEFKLWTQ